MIMASNATHILFDQKVQMITVLLVIKRENFCCCYSYAGFTPKVDYIQGQYKCANIGELPQKHRIHLNRDLHASSNK